MARVFDRLLRVRSLLEEASRVELERQVNMAARAEQALRREAASALRLGQEAVAPLLNSAGGRVETQPESESRYLAGEEREALLPRLEQLARLGAREARRVVEKREEFLARRKDRQQVELLLEAEARDRRVHEARREQRHLDDWFAASRARRRAENNP